MRLPAHGSNVNYLYEALEISRPASVIDFSVNLNPLGTPVRLAAEWNDWFQFIQDYPDPYAKELIRIIGEREQLPGEYLLIGNGAAEIITLIARYLAGEKVLIIHPAFSEYEAACKSEGCDVEYHILDPDWQLNVEILEQKLSNMAAVFLCNPNNPTGVSFEREQIEALIRACEENDTLCIIDEAFYDFLEEPATYIQRVLDSKHVLIIRSLTKMYSIAGLRLGYLAGSPSLLKNIGKSRPHWSVNALALKAGILCIQDKEHVVETRLFIGKERQETFNLLNQLGFQYSPSRVNFYLLRDPMLSNQQTLLVELLKQGLVLRHTYNLPGLEGNWLRVAVKKREDNLSLLEALATWKNEM